MNQAIFKEILPEEFLQRFAQEGIREDGRAFDATRGVKVLRKNKVTLLSMGQTLIMASSEITQREDKQVNGIISSSAPLIDVQVKQNIGQHGSSDICSPIENIKQESYYSQMLTNLLLKNYKNLSTILQVAKEIPATFWSIVVNLRVVNNDGNLSDALILASQIELFNCQVNEIVVKNADGALTIEKIEGRERYLNFSIDEFIYPFTCSQVNANLLLIDPSNYEEAHAATTVQVLVQLGNPAKKSITKLGGADLQISALKEVASKTEGIARSRTNKVREYLTQHTVEFSL